MNDKQDNELVLRVLGGEKSAFELLIRKYQKPIFKLALRMVGDYDCAKDVTQMAFVKTYEKLNTFDPSYRFFNWLYRIALNECLNHLSRRNRREDLRESMESPGADPEAQAIASDTSVLLSRALGGLKSDYRIVLILKHFNGFSYREMSELLGIPEKTVKSRLFTGRRLLREELVKLGYEP